MASLTDQTQWTRRGFAREFARGGVQWRAMPRHDTWDCHIGRKTARGGGAIVVVVFLFLGRQSYDTPMESLGCGFVSMGFCFAQELRGDGALDMSQVEVFGQVPMPKTFVPSKGDLFDGI